MKRSVIGIVGAVLIVVLALVWWLRPRSSTASPSTKAPTTSAPSDGAESAAASATAPGESSPYAGDLGGEFLKQLHEEVLTDDVHRERIRHRIGTLRGEALKDLMETIYQEAWYQDPGFHTMQKLAQLDVEIVLSNRRFAKLRELLKGMPPAKAAATCRAIVEQAGKRADNTVQRALRAYQDPTAPRNTVSTLGNKWGFCTGLLLAAEFCDTKMVLDTIDAAQKSERAWLSAIQRGGEVFPSSLASAVRNYSCLQPAFKLTAVARAAALDDGLPEAAKARLAGILKLMDAKTVPLVSWEADTTAYDFPHRHLGVPVDLSKGVEDFTVYHVPVAHLADSPWQQELLDRVREAFKADGRQ